MLHLRLQLLQLASFSIKAYSQWNIISNKRGSLVGHNATHNHNINLQITVSSNVDIFPMIADVSGIFKHKTPFFIRICQKTHERKLTNIFFKSFTPITAF